jgi:hypothetical protein
MEKKRFDLSVLPVKKNNTTFTYRRDIDPRLPNIHNSIYMLLVAPPRQGKTNFILNWLANKNYYQGYFENGYLIGATIKGDATLKPLCDFYKNVYDTIDDNIIDDIVKFQMSQQPDEKQNIFILIDDALSLNNFDKRNSSLTKLCGNYRHILGNHENGHGGALIMSSQKIKSFNPSMRATANVICLGRISNREEIKIIMDMWADTFGGDRCFIKMLKYCWKDKYSFIVLCIDGSIEHAEPCAYKAGGKDYEMIYPNKFKADNNVLDLELEKTFKTNNENNCPE